MTWMKARLTIPLAIGILASACAHSSDEEDAASATQTGFALADTSWELDEISEGGTSLGVEAGLYTLLIRADGTAAFRLDCNRGFGRWQGDAEAISFSEIGVTKALCPPESISDRVTADLSKFDAYAIDGDQLLLTADEAALTYRWSKWTEESE